MFVRTKERANGKVSILIVENIRKSGKVHQQILRNVATVPARDVARFMEIAEHIKAELEVERDPALFPARTLAEMVLSGRNRSLEDDDPLPVRLSKMREESRIVTGIHEIYGSLYDEIGFPRVLKRCPVSASVMKDIVMARLAKPCSKRASAELLERDFGITIPLVKIYRMMDSLTEDRIKWLQDLCWAHSRSLLTEEIKVMFYLYFVRSTRYDCTTLYFESFTEDELRRFGYSKDHKFNQGQVLLAIMVTTDGLPVGYRVLYAVQV